MNKSYLVFILVFMTLVLSSLSIVAAISPTGVSLTDQGNETAGVDSAGQAEAIAGNLTELDITATSTTQTWQGYFGNVSGTIQLADSNDKVMYNWSLADPQGEVYASKNSSMTWTNIQCFNFTANGTYTDESSSGGTTNLAGTNVSILETEYNIASSAADGVDETFTLLGGSEHDAFTTANQAFSAGECRSTRVFGDTGAGVNDEFEEVLLYEPAGASVVFASILENSDVLGFDDADHDFEMLVLEDGHGSDTDTTTYYFWVELE